MPLKPEQLATALDRAIRPVYCVSGDESLQVREAEDRIRAAVRRSGAVEREVLEVGTGFDWRQLRSAAAQGSLFSRRRLLELVIANGRPGQEGGRAISDYCTQPLADCVLLLRLGKLDARARSAAWLQAVDRAGVWVQVWPLAGRALQTWLQQRLRAAGFEPGREALDLLFERSEGNLLAADQEIEKLRLLVPPGRLTGEMIRELVGDSARYSIFDLGEALLGGDRGRGLRILRGLRQEGQEPLVVLWEMVRELRLVCLLKESPRPDDVLKAQRVFGPRQSLARAAARRGRLEDWQRRLGRCARIDRMAKGAAPGDPWEALRELLVAATEPDRPGGH